MEELADLIEKDHSLAIKLETYLRAVSHAEQKYYLSEESEAEFIAKSKLIKRRKKVRYTCKVAAVFLGVCLLCSGAIYTVRYMQKSSKAEVSLCYSAKKGEVKQITLADGTIVWLAPETELRAPKQFKSNIRAVDLKGEAYFEVTHDMVHPFEVHTSESRVKVLGTRFNIKAYPDDASEETSLLEGKVEVVLGSKKSEFGKEILKPSQKITFTRSSGSYRIENVNLDDILAWRNKRLIFDNESFTEVAKRIERFTGVKLIFKDKNIEKYRFTGDFENESVDDVLNSLKIVKPFSFKKTNNTYYIEKDPESKPPL